MYEELKILFCVNFLKRGNSSMLKSFIVSYYKLFSIFYRSYKAHNYETHFYQIWITSILKLCSYLKIIMEI